MGQKKLMLLGGLRYLIPVINAAHKQGYYVITADYLPNNIAHKYSDEYCNVSIIDKDAVLEKAKKLQIDGIMSFACDPGVVTASYVQNQMGLPSFGPYESVVILQNKDKFRKFLKENGFNVPWAFGFANKSEAWDSRSKFTYPLMVKPTDSAGSKGCKRVDDESTLMEAVDYAFKYSIGGHIIIEEFLEKQGCSSDTDSYSYNGILQFVSYNAQHFDVKATNPYTPAAYSWPSTFTQEQESYLTSEIQRLITLLGMKTCVFNIETRVGTNGKPYIMEFTPRGGGNRLCEMLRYATGIDLISAITRAVVGDEPGIIAQRPYTGHWAEIILHTQQSGNFDELFIDNDMNEFIVEKELWVNRGDRVEGFEGANNAIGTLVLRFNSQDSLENKITTQSEWMKIKLV